MGGIGGDKDDMGEEPSFVIKPLSSALSDINTILNKDKKGGEHHLFVTDSAPQTPRPPSASAAIPAFEPLPEPPPTPPTPTDTLPSTSLVPASAPSPPVKLTSSNEVKNRLFKMGGEVAGELRPMRQVPIVAAGKGVCLPDEMDELTLLGMAPPPPLPLSTKGVTRPVKIEGSTFSHPSPEADEAESIEAVARVGALADLSVKRKQDRDE